MTDHFPFITSERYQKTLVQEVSFAGIGVHTGQCVHMKFIPADTNTGIIFQRTDLKHFPKIPARLDYVVDTSRCTTIGLGGAFVHTVEHVLAALYANQIDNLLIQVSNMEPPVGNGGSFEFVEMIEKAGIKQQDAFTPTFQLTSPIYWSSEDIHLVAIPDEQFKISYTLNYPHVESLKSQYLSLAINAESFKNEIAPCRTFSLLDEVLYLMKKGLIKGGSLDNAVVIKDEAIFSKGGLFFNDEMARHKILDMVGDLSLIGYDIQAHILSIKSGHASNFAFAKKIYEKINLGSLV